MHDHLRDAAAAASAYLTDIGDRSVEPDEASVSRLREALDVPVPATGTSTAEITSFLADVAGPATVANAGPRYFGFVNGGALPATTAASWISTAWDQNAGMRVAAPASTLIEATALRWTAELLGLPAASGGFVTGATMANLTGLAAARHHQLARLGWDVGSDGLFDAPPLRVVVGAEVHVSVRKALSLLGMGAARVVEVPTDDQGRMVASALPSLDDHTIVCVQAGNVNTGASDPLREVGAAVAAANAWMHVDGAFGLWAAASTVRGGLVHGIESADSWATDAHKWLNVPYDCGIVLVADAEPLRSAMATSAAYLGDGSEIEPHHHVPEMSRRARGVEVWAAIRALGADGLAALVDRSADLAVRFARHMTNAGYEVRNDVVLNQVLVSFDDDGHTDRVVAAIQADGTAWMGGTTWHGRRAMRCSVSNWATTEEDIDATADAVIRCAKETR